MRNLSPEEIERERELFEAFMIARGWHRRLFNRNRGGYVHIPVDDQWQCWLASAAVDRSMSSLPLSSEEGGGQ